MSSTLNEMNDQEDGIFRDSSLPEAHRAFRSAQNVAKVMAKQQLRVSEDSPFNLCQSFSDFDEAELERLKEEKAVELKQETDEIKRQLDLVKCRLAQINQNGEPSTDSQNLMDRSKSSTIQDKSVEKEENTVESCHNGEVRAKISDKMRQSDAELRLRPLTGKADCPNCVCDRRSSVCDQCISFKTSQAETYPLINESRKSNGSEVWKQVYKTNYNYDDRPIRPAKDRRLGTVEVVDEVVVPNQVYTISKSLNEKRTKLAQAIEELQLMIERVKERDKRLNEDRKLVQQYKQQWRYGPNIGGPLASSRDRTSINGLRGPSQVRRSYESRLDSDLSRDSRSLMGFQQVAPSKLGPPPRPAARKRIQQSRQHPQLSSRLNLRSKSLESLSSVANPPKKPPRTQTSTQSTRPHHDKAVTNVASPTKDIGQNASNIGQKNSDSSDETEIEDIAELVENDATPKECESRPSSAQKEVMTQQPVSKEAETTEDDHRDKDHKDSRGLKKMNWIPVFGETEVKTVRPRTTPSRKVMIMNKNSQPIRSSLKSSVTSGQVDVSRGSTQITNRIDKSSEPSKSQPVSKSQTGSSNIVLNEATKKLRFAQDLLEQEKSDSKNTNQLIINRARAASPPKPSPRKATAEQGKIVPSASMSSGRSTGTDGRSTANTACEDVLRLEQMVSEQQKLLDNLVNQLKEQQRGSPITVQCSSPCWHQQSMHRSRSPLGGSSRSLVIQHLKDKLNKTKSRLMKMLEEEREKHQQLKQKVDSSLRKQSDLEGENQLLKQSLNKCIDTCLKDISSTFESLGDSLVDSIASISKQPPTEDEVSSIEGGNNLTTLTSAAQLIAENRHLKKMKNHIETIENQRREIFEELKNEKQKVGRLESLLKESQQELDKLGEIKQRLESQLEVSIREQQNLARQQSSQHQSCLMSPVNVPQASGFSSSNAINDEKSTSTDKDASSQNQISSDTKIDSTDSIALYTRFIKSMTPDLDSIMRERKQMLNELDTTRTTIEKMISEMAN